MQIPEEMQMLAGLERIQYVFVYPESGDVVLAGPAGDWIRAAEGNVVSRDSGRPVVKLDDLVVVWRLMLSQTGRGLRLFDYAAAGRLGEVERLRAKIAAEVQLRTAIEGDGPTSFASNSAGRISRFTASTREPARPA